MSSQEELESEDIGHSEGALSSRPTPPPGPVAEPPQVMTPLPLSAYPQESGALGKPTGDDISAFFERLVHAKAYGAPRVFDLFTLLAITLAFALLFAFLRFIDPVIHDVVPQVALSLCGYILLISLAQLLLFQGQSPRVASIAAGPIAWLLVGAGLLISDFSQVRAIPALAGGLLCSCPVGFFTGYLTGGMIAGVFFVADKIRVYWTRNEIDEEPDSSSFWDESAD